MEPTSAVANMHVLTLAKPSSGDLKFILDFDKLKGGENYVYWADKMKDALTYIELWDYVSGVIDYNSLTSPGQRAIFEANDKKALLLIKSKIEQTVHSHIRLCVTSMDIWDKLEDQHKLKGSQGQVELITKWSRIHLKEGGSVTDYLAKHDQCKSEADELDLQFGQTYAALQLLMGLPNSWSAFKQVVQTGSADRDEELDYDKVSKLISQEAAQRKVNKHNTHLPLTGRSRGLAMGDEELAMAVSKKDAICYTCGVKGHYSFECDPNRVRKKNATPTPSNRQQIVYKSKNPPYKENSDPQAKHTQVVDFAAAYSASRVKHSKSRPTPSKRGSSSRQSLHLGDVDVALAVSDGKGKNENSFLLDTGCSHHTCGNIDFFTNMRPYEGVIKVANNEEEAITGIGTMIFVGEIGGDEVSFSLSEVFYIPGFSNLVSLGQLQEKGTTVEFAGKGFTLRMNGRAYAQGTQSNRTFTLDAEAVRVPTCNHTTNPKPSAMTWHRRLCHMSPKYMKELVKAGSLPITNDEIDEAFKTPCVSCTKGKQSKSPFRDSTSRASRPLELIHSDIAGPMPVQTYSGYRYWITIMDDHTRHVWAYPLKRKSHAVTTIAEWIQLTETQSGHKVKKLRTDNGGEYTKLDNLCAEKGIRRETTIAYTPEQNGRAERLNRTMAEKITCMLVDSKLSSQWWAEALRHAVDVINKSPSKPINMKTPFEIWHGVKPDLEDLRAFGTRCEALKLPRVRKLEPKTTSCIYLGNASLKKAYRLWDESAKRIVFSRNVTFFEDNNITELITLPHEDEGGDDSSEEYTASESEGKTDDDQEDRESEEAENDGGNDSDSSTSSSSSSSSSDNDSQDENIPATIHRRKSSRPSKPPGEWWKANGNLAIAEEEVEMEEEQEESKEPTDEHHRTSPEAYFVAHAIENGNVPRTYEEAIARTDKAQWIEAMDKELESLQTNKVYTFTQLPRGRRSVGCKWVFTIKEKPNGEVERYKARLVAQGFSQIQGVDFDDTYAPVAGVNATRFLLTLVNHYGLEMLQVDVKTAYLNGEMREELYMKPPKGLVHPEGMVCKIEKSHYGFKQSAFNWHNKLREKLIEMKFQPIDCEPCMFHRSTDGAIILVYVDDMGIAAKDRQTLVEIFQELRHSFDIEDRGDMTDCNFIGFRVKRDRERRVITLSQERYVDQMIEVFGLEKAPIARTPLPSESHVEPMMEGEERTQNPYLQAVGTIIYIATCTRPDIAYAVGVVARHNAQPTDRHWELVVRIMRYLKHTRNQGLVIEYNESEPYITAYSDADWAGDHDSRKSTSGTVIKAFGNTVLYKSKM